jgi:starvation-inducible DNA-binding protein
MVQSTDPPFEGGGRLAIAVPSAMIISVCNALLAECIDLRAQLRRAHVHAWGQHQLYDTLDSAVEACAIEIALRVAELGGTFDTASPRVTEDPTDAHTSRALAEAIAAPLATFARNARSAIATAAAAGDRTTADVVTQVSRTLDHSLWYVEAHRQSDR